MFALFLNALILAVATPAIPAGIPIPVALNGDVSSRTAHQGDYFTFSTTADVIAGGVSIPKGSIGQGQVTAVSHAVGSHRGTITLQPQFVIAGDRKIAVVEDPSSHFAQAAPRHSFPILIPLPGMPIVGAYQNPGGDVTLGKGTAFVVDTAPQ